MLRTYGKAILAFAYAVAFVAIPLFSGDNKIDGGEGATIVIAACTNALVFLVPLVPSAPWVKTAVGGVLAGAEVAAVVILDHVMDANDTMMIAAAVLGALGIAVAPAATPRTNTAVGWGADRAAPRA